MKYIKRLFFLLVCIFFGYVIYGQMRLPKNEIDHRNVCYEYSGDIWGQSLDGTRFLVEHLGKQEGIVSVEMTIPEDVDNQVTSFCFRGNDAKVYVNNQLRYEYSAENTRWFGSVSPECYMMIPISAADAGCTLRIDLGYSEGILYQSYIGTELGIWMNILKKYIGELFVAAITLVLGCLTIIISKLYGMFKHRKFDIAYLGLGVTLAAVWLVVNSVYRQIIFSNLSIADDFPFLMVMLIPFPFLIYMDVIQEKRYSKLYLTASWILAIIDISCCVLYVLGIKELMETFIFVALACFGAIISVITSFAMDLRSGKILSYKFVAIGLFGAFSSAIIQLVTYFNRTGIFSGAYLAIGLICLLVGAAIHTVHSIFSIEKDKTAAVLANETKGRFLANMSHEIRTPINAVLGMNEMILRESSETNIREYALDIQNAGKNLLSLINDILDISKIESGKMEIIPIEYDVSSMINDTMNMIYHKAKEKDLYVTLHVDEQIPSRLLGDDIRIRQILINILNNAVKYTNDGGVTLEVTYKKREDNRAVLHFSIRDTGIGIKEEDLPKLYKQFERIEESRNRNVEGTGLGMSITLQLLELMNSRLDIESVYGEGSCFYFDLEQEIVEETPIGDLSERIRRQEEEYVFENSFIATSANILVVDDNAVNRKVFCNLLKDVGVKIDEADSGENCLKLACERKYDMIFLDHMMPGLDGIQTRNKLADIEDNPNIDTPVIALTANAITGAREMYLNAGFDDFMSKPIIYSKLESLILKYLPEDKIMTLPASNQKKNSFNLANSEGNCFQIDNQTMTSAIEAIPELNMEYALLVHNSIELLFETVVAFSDMMENDLKELNQYKMQLPSEEAINQYRVKIHSMKTSAAMVGLMNLSGMARLLELAAIDKNLDDIECLHPVFVKEWQRNQTIIKMILNEYREKIDAQRQNNHLNGFDVDDVIELNVDLLFEQLKMLREAVASVDVDKADAIVDLIKGFDYPKDVEVIMKQLYSAVVSLDEEAVDNIIAQLEEKII